MLVSTLAAGFDKRTFWTRSDECGWYPPGEPCPNRKRASDMAVPHALDAWREKASKMRQVLSSLEKRTFFTRQGPCGYETPGNPCVINYKEGGDGRPVAFPKDNDARLKLAEKLREIPLAAYQ
ncbi:hypothetical protein FSP39_023589 [Pinctada imbricata]|uniref:Uncharacterized protein n=1 Tax=Pinctada imbricata TaxID=66713 RepID=A0AA89CCD2_PINIB|nr:hypothetical protein FSP39_023589 [Pinctada imbricata]